MYFLQSRIRWISGLLFSLLEQMLHAAGFQNIRSGMITPFSYVSVGRKTEEKPAMIKLVGLSDEQVKEISRRIGRKDI